jgi:hypothetical protein
MGVARMGEDSATPVLVVPGRLSAGWEAILPYVDGVEPVAGGAFTEAQAMENPARALSATVERALPAWLTMRRVSPDA